MRLVTKVLATEPKLMADEEAFRSAYLGREYPRPAPVPAALRWPRGCRARPSRAGTSSRSPHATPGHRGRSSTSTGRVCRRAAAGALGDHPAAGPAYWATVTVPLYPLAPEHDHRVGNDHVAAFYRDLVGRVDPRGWSLMGDSAGGGMSLVQAMRARDAGLPLPARVVLFAPWVNVLPVNPEIAAIEPRDPVLAVVPGGSLAGRWWAGADDPRDPDISPLFGDLAGLPPIDIFQGTADILWPDSLLIAERIGEVGGVVNLYEYDDAIHVFVAATFTPEARAAYAQIAAALDSPQVSIGRGTQVVTNPSVMFSRALATRLVEQEHPWINHMGARARVELASRRARLPLALTPTPVDNLQRHTFRTVLKVCL